MSKRRRSSKPAQPRSRPVRWRIALSAAVGLVILAALLFDRSIMLPFARTMAVRQIDSGAISAAQWSAAWCEWLDTDSGEADLIRATCFRHLDQPDCWEKVMRSAAEQGAPADRVQQELTLCGIHKGLIPEESIEGTMVALIERGASGYDTAVAYIRGCLAQKQPDKAKAVFDIWAAGWPDEAQTGYVRGLYLQWCGDLAEAESEFERVLATRPRHELARAALAELFESRRQLGQALRQYVELGSRAPASEAANVGLARIMRKTSHFNEARALIEPLVAQAEPSGNVLSEMGQIELATGNYEEAQRWFDRAGIDPSKDSSALAAAITLGLCGKTTDAERLFHEVFTEATRSDRMEDLKARLSVDPNDTVAAEELQRLTRLSAQALAAAGTAGGRQDGEGRRAATGDRSQSATTAAELYALHCSACHGANGDGNGRAARHLFPRPRDLRTGKSRLVSTRNGIPTLEDIETVIQRGMPGTSMPAFESLTADQRKLLAGEVLRLNRQGVREQFIETLKSEGEEIDDSDVRQVVELCTTPGESVRTPHIGPADAAAIARGKDTYFELGCQKCHGDDGSGAWDTPHLDEKGNPSVPRNLVYDSFKGGDDPESIYLRIFIGMPGTPHPACSNVEHQRLIDLVHYCRSLSREPKRRRTNHQRAVEAVTRPYGVEFAAAAD